MNADNQQERSSHVDTYVPTYVDTYVPTYRNTYCETYYSPQSNLERLKVRRQEEAIEEKNRLKGLILLLLISHC